MLPVRHRALRCAPALLAWEPPPGFKEWKEGDVPFDEEEDDRSFDMFDLVSDGPERRPGSQRRASSPEDFVEALLDVPAGCCPGCGATFQSDDPDAPGFVPQSVLDARSAAGAKVEGGEGAPLATRTETICQRCHAAPAPTLPSLTPEPDPTRALSEVSIAPPPAPGATACATRTGCLWRRCAWARRRSTRSCSRSTSASEPEPRTPTPEPEPEPRNRTLARALARARALTLARSTSASCCAASRAGAAW